MTPETHRQVRRHVKENFNASLLESYHCDISRHVRELCDSLTSLVGTKGVSDVVDISVLVANATFAVISDTAFGCRLSKEERDELRCISDEAIQEMLVDFFGYPFRHWLSMFGTRRKFMQLVQKVEDKGRKYVQMRLSETKEQRERRQPDLLDALVGLQDQDFKALLANTVVFALAGAHTTAEVVNWSIYKTCCHPQEAKKMHREIDDMFGHKDASDVLSKTDVEQLTYVKHVWNETLRMHTAGPVLIREAAEKDVTLAGSGLKIGKGGQVVALIQGAHMDKGIWDRPEEFMPQRWEDIEGGKRIPPGAFLPFSAGAHNCAGQFFANYEGRFILTELHRRFEFDLACKPEEIYSCSGWVEGPKRRARVKGEVESGVPVFVRLRK